VQVQWRAAFEARGVAGSRTSGAPTVRYSSLRRGSSVAIHCQARYCSVCRKLPLFAYRRLSLESRLFAFGSRVKAVEMNALGERIFGMQLLAMDRRHDQISDGQGSENTGSFEDSADSGLGRERKVEDITTVFQRIPWRSEQRISVADQGT
jgi:hypothetical protein